MSRETYKCAACCREANPALLLGIGGICFDCMKDALDDYWGRHAGETHPDFRTDEERADIQARMRYKKRKISPGLRTRVFERDAYRCRQCGGHRSLQCDHVIPESKGGPTTFENLQTLCRACNLTKSNKL